MSNKGIFSLGFFSILAIIIVIWVIKSINVINETERGIEMRGGKIVNVVEPGYNLIFYPIHTMETLSIQQDTNRFPAVMSKTYDEQVTQSEVSVTFRLKDDDESLRHFYKNFKTMDNFIEKILRRNITNQLQIVMGQFTAQETVRKKQELDQMYYDLMVSSLKDSPIEILSVQIEKISPSDKYNQRIEKRMEAEIEIMTRQQNLETEKLNAEIVRTQAQAEADRILIQRQAEADGILAVGKAEAEAIELKNNALYTGDGAVLIEYTKALNWDGAQPTTIISGIKDLNPIMDMRNKPLDK